MSAFDDTWAFGQQVATLLRSVLGDEFVGAYFVGSIALGGYVAGQSDIDIVAVCRRPLADDARDAAADALLAVTVDCPARGLELTLYRAAVASTPPRLDGTSQDAGFEVNVNGGPRMDRVIHRASRDEPAFWYVLDRAIAHRSGIAIEGPEAARVFADVTRAVLLAAMRESMRWHREHEKATLYSVLNACRAWRFAAEDVLGSKLDGARWARPQWPTPEMIDAAVDLRHGRSAHLDPKEVDSFLLHVERILAEAP